MKFTSIQLPGKIGQTVARADRIYVGRLKLSGGQGTAVSSETSAPLTIHV
jgi:hypothetical protein